MKINTIAQPLGTCGGLVIIHHPAFSSGFVSRETFAI
jgi:hypothetical protein